LNKAEILSYTNNFVQPSKAV